MKSKPIQTKKLDIGGEDMTTTDSLKSVSLLSHEYRGRVGTLWCEPLICQWRYLPHICESSMKNLHL